jgi:hypothetical protein
MNPTFFLKRVLLLDAASCLALGGPVALVADGLSSLTGLPASLLFGAGMALLPLGLFIFWVATRPAIHPLFVYLIVAGNLLWSLESLMVITGSPTITPFGTLFVAGQAAAVAALAALEWIGVRRARRATASA